MNAREQTRQNYDRLSRWYDLFASSERKFTQAGLCMLDVQAGEYVLEIGFGTGHSLIRIAQQAGDSGLVAGVELSPGMIAVARKRVQEMRPDGRLEMVGGDAILLPFRSHSFDAVFLSFTLELFPEGEIPLLLAQCRRILKSDGRLGVVSLAKQDALACRLYEWGHERWPALLDCRPIEAINSLEAAGFRVRVAKVETMWGLPVETVLAVSPDKEQNAK